MSLAKDGDKMDPTSRLAFRANPELLHQGVQQRRMSRNESEKNRRDRQNAQYGEIHNLLSELLPWVGDANRKMDKASIIRLACYYFSMHLYSSMNKTFQRPILEEKYDININDMIQEVCDFIMFINKRDYTLIHVTGGITKKLGHRRADIMNQSVYHLIHHDDLQVLQEQFYLYSSQRNGRKRNHSHDFNADATFSFSMHMVDYTSKQHNKYEQVNCTGHIRDFNVDCQQNLGLSEVLVCCCRLAKNDKVEKLLMNWERQWISYHDIEGKIIDSDSSCAIPSGFLPEETRGTHPYMLLHPDDVGPVSIWQTRLMQTGNVPRSVFRMFSKSGEILHVMNVTMAVVDTNKKFRYILSHNFVMDERDFPKLQKEQLTLIDELTKSTKCITLDTVKTQDDSAIDIDSSQQSPDSSSSDIKTQDSNSKKDLTTDSGEFSGNEDKYLVLDANEENNSSLDKTTDKGTSSQQENIQNSESSNDNDVPFTKLRILSRSEAASRANTSLVTTTADYNCTKTNLPVNSKRNGETSKADRWAECSKSETDSIHSIASTANTGDITEIQSDPPQVAYSQRSEDNECLIDLLQSNEEPLQSYNVESTLLDLGISRDNPAFLTLVDVLDHKQNSLLKPGCQGSSYDNNTRYEIPTNTNLPSFNSCLDQPCQSDITGDQSSSLTTDDQLSYCPEYTRSISDQSHYNTELNNTPDTLNRVFQQQTQPIFQANQRLPTGPRCTESTYIDRRNDTTVLQRLLSNYNPSQILQALKGQIKAQNQESFQRDNNDRLFQCNLGNVDSVSLQYQHQLPSSLPQRTDSQEFENESCSSVVISSPEDFIVNATNNHMSDTFNTVNCSMNQHRRNSTEMYELPTLPPPHNNPLICQQSGGLLSGNENNKFSVLLQQQDSQISPKMPPPYSSHNHYGI